MSGQRETAMLALQAVVNAAYSWSVPVVRRLKLFDDVPLETRPCAFQFEGGDESYTWTNSVNPKRTLPVEIYSYFNAKDDSVIGATFLNEVSDALDSALAPPPGKAFQTLGDTVFQCRIRKNLRVPGDIDGDGMLVTYIEIVIP